MHIPPENIVDLRHAKKKASPPLPLVHHKAHNFAVSFLKKDAHTPDKKQKASQKQMIRTKNLSGVRIGRPLTTITILIGVCAMLFYGFHVYSAAKSAKGKVLGETHLAFSDLRAVQGGTSVAPDENAIASLESAKQHFQSASNSLNELKSAIGVLQYAPYIKNNVSAAEHLINAGDAITQVVADVSESVNGINNSGHLGYVSFFSEYSSRSSRIQEQLTRAKTHIEQVRITDIPKSYREEFAQGKNEFSSTYDVLARANGMASLLSQLMGFTSDQKMLFIFQNNQELRPTGGFMGSIATVSFSKGLLKDVAAPKGGSYDIAGQVTMPPKAPRPLQLVNPYLNFQDANWFPDFPTSAERILQFYADAGNEPVDGIFAFTPDVLISLLRLTGPVAVSETEQVDADNVVIFLRGKIDEEKASDPTQPKKIIGQLMPKILVAALQLPPSDQLQLASLMNDAIYAKDLLLFSQHPDIQQNIKDIGASGEMPHPQTDDFFALNSANIGGGKTDRLISQHVSLDIRVKKDTTDHVATITRTRSDLTGDAQQDVVNLSYVRLYVPKGSIITSANGWHQVPESLYLEPTSQTPEDAFVAKYELNPVMYEQYKLRTTEEYGYTCIGGWIRVATGETTTATVSYRSPIGLHDSSQWSVFLLRQPGMQETGITASFSSERVISSIKSSFSDATITGSSQVSFDLNTDGIIGVELK